MSAAVLPLYPVYVVSKGRADVCHTARFLREDRVPFRLVVEVEERDRYLEAGAREEELLVRPVSGLPLSGVRNFVWEHAASTGAARHWILDDNVLGVWRRWRARKIRCDSGPAMRICETFVDRYENVGVAGLNYFMFSPNREKQPPYALNAHVYSFVLVDCALPLRWRGVYNEDVDLCLQVLASGLCTVLFNAFLCYKMTTMTVKGGNTAELYGGDGRLKMSRALERAWPGIVTTTRRFQRPQHLVKGAWRAFDTPLKLRPGVDLSAFPAVDEHGLGLVQRGEGPRSPAVRALVAGRARPAST